MHTLPLEDLCAVHDLVGDAWDALRGKQVWITGGTGFIGRWLLESFCFANERCRLEAKMHVLTRRPQAFLQSAGHLVRREDLAYHVGDIKTFAFPKGSFPYVIHGAAEVSSSLLATKPLTVYDSIVQGTRRCLELAAEQTECRFLFLSSGAVYGKCTLDHQVEEAPSCIDLSDPRSAYAEGKRAAELLCTLFGQESQVQPVVARCFAFVGPHLPLDRHFAIGNFMQDVLCGRQVVVKGDGSAVRSYLYASDLATWLWKMLLTAPAFRTYNVGSEAAYTIGEVADIVARSAPINQGVAFLKQACYAKPDRYVPSVKRICRDLHVRQTVDVAQAVAKTLDWYAQRKDLNAVGGHSAGNLT